MSIFLWPNKLVSPQQERVVNLVVTRVCAFAPACLPACLAGWLAGCCLALLQVRCCGAFALSSTLGSVGKPALSDAFASR